MTFEGHDAQLELWRRIHELAESDPDQIKTIAELEIRKREAGLLDRWEIPILVASNDGITFSEEHHESFRQILCGLPGNSGTTTRPAGDGDWNDRDTGKVYAGKMIPIRFRACPAEAEHIADCTWKFHDQIEVMAYRIAAGQHIILAGPTSKGNETTEAR